MPLVVILLSQLLFTSGDLLARSNLRNSGFSTAILIAPWFWLYFLLRSIAMFGQLYVIAGTPVGKVMPLFSASSLILINILSVLFLGEVLPIVSYIGISLVIIAILLIGFYK